MFGDSGDRSTAASIFAHADAPESIQWFRGDSVWGKVLTRKWQTGAGRSDRRIRCVAYGPRLMIATTSTVEVAVVSVVEGRSERIDHPGKPSNADLCSCCRGGQWRLLITETDNAWCAPLSPTPWRFRSGAMT